VPFSSVWVRSFLVVTTQCPPPPPWFLFCPPQVLGKGVLSSGCNQCCVKTIVVLSQLQHNVCPIINLIWRFRVKKREKNVCWKNRMFLNIFSFTKSCSWKKIFFENSNNFLTNNLISVKAAKVTMVFKFVNPFMDRANHIGLVLWLYTPTCKP
jgi:hypothetical protein